MNPRRIHQIRHLIKLLALARSPNEHEAASAKRHAHAFRKRNHVTDMEIATIRTMSERQRADAVDLDGWTEPWLVAVGLLVAAARGISAGVAVRPGGRPVMRFKGEGAGDAAEWALSLRALVATRIGKMGGEAGVRRLPLRHNPSAMDSWMLSFTGAQLTMLGDTYGDGALDVFRVAVAMAWLKGDLDRARMAMVKPPLPVADATTAETNDLMVRAHALVRRAAHVSQERPSWLYEDTAPTRALVLCA